MSTAELPVETPVAQPYHMPDVEGELLVNWYPNATPNEAPMLAAVIRRFPSSVQLMTISEGGLVYKHSVRHRSDPVYNNNPHWGHDGCWDYTNQSIQFKAALARIAALEAAALNSRAQTAESEIIESMKEQINELATQVHALRVRLRDGRSPGRPPKAANPNTNVDDSDE